MLESVMDYLLVIGAIAGTIIMIVVATNTSAGIRPIMETSLKGGGDEIAASLAKMADRCWNDHGWGADMAVDDCYTVDIQVTSGALAKDTVERVLACKTTGRCSLAWQVQVVEGKQYVKIIYDGPNRAIAMKTFSWI